MSSPPRRRRLRVASVILLAGAGLVTSAFFLADWRLLASEYHAFLLGRAGTEADAKPHLQALLGLANHPRASEALVARLGARNPKLTFWVFGHIVHLGIETATGDFAAQGDDLAAALPWVRDLGRRLDRDPGLLGDWAHFLRWSRAVDWTMGSIVFPALSIRKPPSIPDNVLGFVGAVLGAPFEGGFHEAAAARPESFEGLLRVWHLEILGLEWICGAPEAGSQRSWRPIPAGRPLFAYAEGLERAEARLRAWFDENRAALRFDHATGRLVVKGPPSSGGPAGAAAALAALAAARAETIPSPLPFAGWAGPVPEHPAAVIPEQVILSPGQVTITPAPAPAVTAPRDPVPEDG